VSTLNDNFLIFNDYQTLHVLDIYGSLQGEWNLNLNLPRRWEVNYNEIDLVLERLRLAEEALRSIVEVDAVKFKTTLLMSKYLREEDRNALKKFEDRHYVG
jgi:hypothetical protein